MESPLRKARPKARLTDKSDWYKIKNLADTKSAEVMIFDEISQFGVTAQDFVNDISDLKCENLTVHLNSGGGDVFDGLTIYNALKEHPAHVTVMIDGLAASIASIIAMAGDRVVMAKTANIMIHDAWTVGMGNAQDMRKTADLLDKMSDNLASVYADRTGTDKDGWRDLMKAETWFSASEAVEAGLADEVQGPKPKAQNAELSIKAEAVTETAEVEEVETVEPALVWDADLIRSTLEGAFKL